MTDGFGGYMDKLLRVNLSQNRFNEEKLPTDMRDRFLGGRGIGAKILYDEVGPEVKPLTPENKIIIMTGPLTGTKTPGSHLHIIQTLSPLTGIYLNTVAMGRFGWMLKHAGYDGLIIEGKAEDPSFISVTPEGVEIRDARFVWGMATDNTQEFVKEAIREPRAIVACIGPAGERLVPSVRDVWLAGVVLAQSWAPRISKPSPYMEKQRCLYPIQKPTQLP
jgi:aldehyde:ferredoxin oxidoreductase